MTETEQMLMDVLGCHRVDLYAQTLSLSEEQKKMFAAMQKRRQSGEPLQYILGTCEFMGLAFKVDSRALVPRPETEILVEVALKKIRALPTREVRVLDIGTGSGNIAVSLAKCVDTVSVVAVDVSGDAITLAKENAALHGVDKRVECICDDVQNYFHASARRERFDVIISNPPYIKSDAISTLPMDVQQEPRRALDGGSDGLAFYKMIISQSPEYLKKDGFLMMEIGDGQAVEIDQIFQKMPGFSSRRFIKDYTCVNRVVVAQLTEPLNL